MAKTVNKEEKSFTPNVRWLYNYFVYLNNAYFNGRLPIPEFAVQCPEDSWACYYPQFQYNDKTRRVANIKGNGTIAINGNYARTESSWINTLAHEMVHEYVFLIQGVYPENPHGIEFKTIANEVMRRSGGKIKITETDDKINSDAIAKKRGGYKGDGYENAKMKNATKCMVCMIVKPKGKNYKYWFTKTDEANKARTLNAVKLIPGAYVRLFYCYSVGLFKDTIEPDTLKGFGGMTAQEALTKMAAYYHEPLQMFAEMEEIK